MLTVKERVSGTKHLQFMCGLHYAIYWMANIMWDFLIYLIPCITCVIMVLAFAKPGFTTVQEQVQVDPAFQIEQSEEICTICINYRACWYWDSLLTAARRYR